LIATATHSGLVMDTLQKRNWLGMLPFGTGAIRVTAPLHAVLYWI